MGLRKPITPTLGEPQPQPVAVRNVVGEDASCLNLQREIFDLYALFDIIRRFSAVLDTTALLDGILLTTICQLGVGAAAVVIQEPGEEDRLSVAKWKGWTDARLEDWALDLNSPFARVLAGTEQPILFHDLRGRLDPAWPQTSFLERMGCVLVAPMRRRERLRGVLYASGRLNGQLFSDTDREFLGLLVDQLTVSIENAVLYESERRYAEDLILAREQLAQSEKMATMGRLSASIAHEINNPLGIIRNYLQLIRSSLRYHGETVHNLDQVAVEVDRIARIVRQLLDAFHPETTRPAAVDIGLVLSEIIEFLAPELTRCGIIVTHSSFDNLPLVIGSADSLRQVFLNLTLNARDAMPTGGRLQIWVTSDEHTVVVSFVDEGEGIAPENLPRLFEPFFSTKLTGHGTGLGLSICRGILQGFNGSIEAFNVEPPRTGAVFRVQLRTVGSLQEVDEATEATLEGGRK